MGGTWRGLIGREKWEAAAPLKLGELHSPMGETSWTRDHWSTVSIFFPNGEHMYDKQNHICFFSLLASEMFTAAMTVGSVGYTNDATSRTACNPLNTNVWLLLNRLRIMKPRVHWLIIGRKSRYSHSMMKKLAPTKQACRTVHRRIQDFTIEGVHVVGAGPAVRGTSVLQKLKQSVELVYNL